MILYEQEMIQMKKRHFDVGTDGFYGAYWKCKSDSDCAMSESDLHFQYAP